MRGGPFQGALPVQTINEQQYHADLDRRQDLSLLKPGEVYMARLRLINPRSITPFAMDFLVVVGKLVLPEVSINLSTEDERIAYLADVMLHGPPIVKMRALTAIGEPGRWWHTERRKLNLEDDAHKNTLGLPDNQGSLVRGQGGYLIRTSLPSRPQPRQLSRSSRHKRIMRKS